MNRNKPRQLRTTIRDLDPKHTIRPLTDHELRLASGGLPPNSSPMTTNVDGAGATDDVG
jgi:hypothetical protein